MRVLTIKEQNWYTNGINGVAGLAKENVELIARQLVNAYSSNRKIDYSGLRVATINAIDGAMSFYGNSAKVIANDFFDHCMKLQDSEIRSNDFEFDWDKSWIEGKIKYILQYLVDGDLDRYINECGEYASFLTNKSGFDQLINNSVANDLRYARVPQAGCCAFCIMLAGRGFVYHSEETAGFTKGGHPYHNHCRCIAVPKDSKDFKVKGYNPKEYKAMYDSARAELDVDGKTGKQLTKETLSIMRNMNNLK